MIDLAKLQAVIAAYKQHFPGKWWEDEKFKWETVKRFQDHWDVNAPNFAEMFLAATDKSLGLLASMNNYPRGMIKSFAEADTEATRAMFISLFDETIGVAERIDKFQSDAEAMRLKYDKEGTWKQHFQTANAITTYLWLRFPDKYYIYKYSEIRALAKELDSSFVPKKGASTNVISSFELCDEVREILQSDSEIVRMLKKALTEDCYPDSTLHTLMVDFVFFVSRVYSQGKTASKNRSNTLLVTETNGGAQSDIISESNPLVQAEADIEPYTREDFLNQVYMTEERFETLTALLKHKKNLVLQGAPGVGKTFTAKRLAYAMMGKKDNSRIEFIQFHQNYSYEDFIMGYKPQEEGFKLTNGIFYQFCQRAANQPDQDFFFIIDEINRGNISKIFGELLMLIERDYRGTEATLAYSGAAFSVPKNLYLIGLMNTADRSLAMIDYALRRRFSFFEMEPGFHSDGFQTYAEAFHNETFHVLIERIKELNKEILTDDSLGAGFRIGHSYFCGQETCTDEWMKEVVYYDIIPMLQEYWFDDQQKVQRWENILSGVFND
ncbi:AAA family ATPase [Anaerotruncus rubiinfantis]|uniref:AAA family ATPase n=1 Tax=Anaerotruncus rubiinfantis TaxID=1720200 RepID=UPI0034A322A2